MKPTCEMEEEECCNRHECIREEEETGNNNNYSLVAYYLPADREIGHHFKLIALMFLSLLALNIYNLFLASIIIYITSFPLFQLILQYAFFFSSIHLSLSPSQFHHLCIHVASATFYREYMYAIYICAYYDTMYVFKHV